jgi:hypothetical protein
MRWLTVALIVCATQFQIVEAGSHNTSSNKIESEKNIHLKLCDSTCRHLTVVAMLGSIGVGTVCGIWWLITQRLEG